MGKHSYAIYLWHYPIIVLHRMVLPDLDNSDFAAFRGLSIFAAVILFSWMTEKMVDVPFKRLKWSNQKIIAASIIAILAAPHVVNISCSLQLDDISVPDTISISRVFQISSRSSADSLPTGPQLFPPPPGAELTNATYFFIGDSYVMEW